MRIIWWSMTLSRLFLEAVIRIFVDAEYLYDSIFMHGPDFVNSKILVLRNKSGNNSVCRLFYYSTYPTMRIECVLGHQWNRFCLVGFEWWRITTNLELFPNSFSKGCDNNGHFAGWTGMSSWRLHDLLHLLCVDASGKSPAAGREVPRLW